MFNNEIPSKIRKSQTAATKPTIHQKKKTFSPTARQGLKQGKPHGSPHSSGWEWNEARSLCYMAWKNIQFPFEFLRELMKWALPILSQPQPRLSEPEMGAEPNQNWGWSESKLGMKRIKTGDEPNQNWGWSETGKDLLYHDLDWTWPGRSMN